jgi:hypothetical protein
MENSMLKLELPQTIGTAIALMSLGVATSAAQPSRTVAMCAEREALLELLIEAHGAAPNRSSVILDNNAVALIHARAACDEGRSTEAIATYDHLIGEMTASLQRLNTKMRPNG